MCPFHNQPDPCETCEEIKSHQFWLRSDFLVEIALPVDITIEEVSRVQEFLDLIPRQE